MTAELAMGEVKRGADFLTEQRDEKSLPHR